MKMRVLWPLLVSAALISGCGGSSGSGTQQPVAAPTPTPVPTPTPTPTPAPVAPYDLGFDLSRDRFFNLIGAEIRSVSREVGTTSSEIVRSEIDAVLLEDNASAQLTYAFANQQASVTVGGGGPLLFSQSQLVLNRSDALSYVAPTATLAIVQPGPLTNTFSQVLRYVVIVPQSQSSVVDARTSNGIERRFVTGSPTVPQDIPPTRTSEYTTRLLTSFVQPVGSGTGQSADAILRVNHAANTVDAVITATASATPSLLPSVTLTLAGQINPLTGRITGSVTSAEGFAGRFYGRFYGPNAIEYGLVFIAARDNQRLIGSAVGVRR